MTIMICLYYVICWQEANYVGLSLILIVVVVVIVTVVYNVAVVNTTAWVI